MGREQWFLIPKGEISLLEIRSKIERQGVLKEKFEKASLFLYLIVVILCISGLIGQIST